MKKYVVFIFFLGLLSCHAENLIDEEGVTKIILIDKERKIVVNDEDSIFTIVKKINRAIYDPAIYLSEYKVNIYYCDSIVAILCNSNYIKIEGKTYKLKKPLKSYFK